MSEKIPFIVFALIFAGITYILSMIHPILGFFFALSSTGFWLAFLGAMGILG